MEAEIQRFGQLLLHLHVTSHSHLHRRQHAQQNLVRRALEGAGCYQRLVLLHVQLAQAIDGCAYERLVVERPVEQGTAQLCVTRTAGMYAVLATADGAVGIHFTVWRVKFGGIVLYG